MKKLFCLLLGLFLFLSASALAEYDQYRLTVGDVSAAVRWEIFPLDGHNVIVRAHNPGNWHVTWYRDGEPIRDLVPQGDYDRATSAEPVFEPDGSFTMLCRIPSDKPDTNGYNAPPPNASARWTEDGLTGITPLEERVKATRWDNRIVIYETDQYQRIRYNGKDSFIPLDLANTMWTSRWIALADEVLLTNYKNRETEESGVLCLDHGNVRFRIPKPDCWSLDYLPDGRRGFFASDWDIEEWTLKRNDSPVRMYHFNPDGQQDRRYLLQGDGVYLTPLQLFTDPGTGVRTLYGSMQSSSGKVNAVFAMGLDEDMNITGLDVRNIDPDYRKCETKIYLTAGGLAYVYLFNRDNPEAIRPALIPFSLMESSSDTHGLTLQQK